MNNRDIKDLCLVGHRGLPEYFPENSLLGLEAAFEQGADAVELDVQLSAAGVPLVFHDVEVDRVSEVSGRLSDLSDRELIALSCHEPSRFGGKFNPTGVPTLEQVCNSLSKYKKQVFIELKRDALEKHDVEHYVTASLLASAMLGAYRTIISYDLDILRCVRQRSTLHVGWVLTRYDEASMELANAFCPEMIICNERKISRDAELWPGRWSWMVYDIVDIDEARAWLARGVNYIESWDVTALNGLREVVHSETI